MKEAQDEEERKQRDKEAKESEDSKDDEDDDDLDEEENNVQPEVEVSVDTYKPAELINLKEIL